MNFDYIIVGLGAGGSVVASRLIEAGLNVALVDAGSNYTYNSKITTPSEAVSLYNFPTYQPPYEPEYDQWVFNSLGGFNSKKEYVYSRGTGVGGSSNHHAMTMFRGSPSVYDEWATITNDSSWKYKNLLRLFKKIENCEYAEKNDKYRGKDGWLNITKVEPESLDITFIDACMKMGFPLSNNQNGNPKNILGTGFWDASIKKGERSAPAVDLLLPITQKYKNHKWFLNHFVKKLILEKSNSNINCVGVKIIEQKYAYGADTQNDSKYVGKTKKIYGKVILCCGAINTPQILMLSGVGDKEHLKEHNIKCLLNRTGVGQNVQDHAKVCIVNKINKHWHPRSTQGLRYPEICKSIYDLQKLGPYASNGSCCGLDCHVPSGEKISNRPDIHCQTIYAYFRNLNWEEDYCIKPTTLKDCNFNVDRLYTPHISTIIECCHPKARGYIKLKSSKWYDPPLIQEGLDNEDDLKILIEGVNIIRQIYKSDSFKGKDFPNNENYDLLEVLPGVEYDSYDKIKSYIINNCLNGHHIVGTCRMGRSDDKMAVVDSKCNVIGISNLKIVDGSVMPTICSQNSALPIYMIAEKVAEQIIYN